MLTGWCTNEKYLFYRVTLATHRRCGSKAVSIKKSTDRDPKKKIQPKVKTEEPVVTMDSQPANPATVTENIKTREDGSQYKEIEYQDGTMEVVELNET